MDRWYGDGEIYFKVEADDDNIYLLKYKEGHIINYWTARGTVTKKDFYNLTLDQLKKWGCNFHSLSVGEKPAYDLLICDKTKRIEEI